VKVIEIVGFVVAVCLLSFLVAGIVSISVNPRKYGAARSLCAVLVLAGLIVATVV
jgi:hypothetical protein